MISKFNWLLLIRWRVLLRLFEAIFIAFASSLLLNLLLYRFIITFIHCFVSNSLMASTNSCDSISSLSISRATFSAIFSTSVKSTISDFITFFSPLQYIVHSFMNHFLYINSDLRKYIKYINLVKGLLHVHLKKGLSHQNSASALFHCIKSPKFA